MPYGPFVVCRGETIVIFGESVPGIKPVDPVTLAEMVRALGVEKQ
jgi:hypothetical protein